nr:hypothetical protein GCM10020092_049820 [Actinoplanes digitatis]
MFRRVAGCHPAGDDRAGDRGGALGPDQRGALGPRRARPEQGGRAEQDQPVDPFARVRGEPHGGHSAQRQPADVRPRDAEAVQQVERVAPEVGQGVTARGYG